MNLLLGECVDQTLWGKSQDIPSQGCSAGRINILIKPYLGGNIIKAQRLCEWMNMHLQDNQSSRVAWGLLNQTLYTIY